jgi:hypothetical protein
VCVCTHLPAHRVTRATVIVTRLERANRLFEPVAKPQVIHGLEPSVPLAKPVTTVACRRQFAADPLLGITRRGEARMG